MFLHVTVVAADAAEQSSSASAPFTASDAASHTATGHQQANADQQASAVQRNGSARSPPAQQQRDWQPAEPAAPATAGAPQASSAPHSEASRQQQHEQLPQQLPEQQHAQQLPEQQHAQHQQLSQQLPEQQQAGQQQSYLARSLAAMTHQRRRQWHKEQRRIKHEATEMARLVPVFTAADALLDLAGMQATVCQAAALVCLAASPCVMRS